MISFFKNKWLWIVVAVIAYFVFFKKATPISLSKVDMYALIGFGIGQRGSLTTTQEARKTQLIAIGNQMRLQGKTDEEIKAYAKANWIP